MLRNLGKNKFGGQATFGEVGSDSLLRPFRGDLRVEEHQYRRASSAERGAKDPGLSSEFLERGQQRTKRRTIRLVNSVFERR